MWSPLRVRLMITDWIADMPEAVARQASRAFERGQPVLEQPHGGVAKARIDVAVDLVGELRRRIGGAGVHEARGEEHRLAVLAVVGALEAGPARRGSRGRSRRIEAGPAVKAASNSAGGDRSPAGSSRRQDAAGRAESPWAGLPLVGSCSFMCHGRPFQSCTAENFRFIWLRSASSRAAAGSSRAFSMRSRYSGVMSPVT